MNTIAASLEESDWQPRWRELVQGIVRVHTERGEQQLLDTLAHPKEPTVLAFVNAHAMNSAAQSKKFFEAIMAALALQGATIVIRQSLGELRQPVIVPAE